MSDLAGHSLAELGYSWANETLAGHHGFGVVATSANWRWTTSRGPAELAAWLNDEGIDSTAEGMFAARFMPDHEFGAALVLKRYLGKDTGGRVGRFLVRVIVDADRRMGALFALQLALQELPAMDWPVSERPTRDIPPPELRPVAMPTPTTDELALMLQVLSDPTPMQVRGGASPLSYAARTLAHLPVELSTSLSFSTYESKYGGTRCLLLRSNGEPGAAPSLATLVTQSAQQTATPEPGLRTLAADYLRLVATMSPPRVGTVADLHRWVKRGLVRGQRPEQLSTTQLIDQLLDPDSDMVRVNDCLADIARREVNDELDVELRRAASQALTAEQKRAVREALRPDLVDDQSHDVLGLARQWGAGQEELEVIARALLAKHLAGKELSSGQLASIAEFVVAEAARADADRLADITGDAWAQTILTSRWGPAGVRIIREFWVEGAGPDDRLQFVAVELTKRFPTEVARLLGEYRPRPERLETVVRAFPTGTMGLTVAVINASGLVTPWGEGRPRAATTAEQFAVTRPPQLAERQLKSRQGSTGPEPEPEQSGQPSLADGPLTDHRKSLRSTHRRLFLARLMTAVAALVALLGLLMGGSTWQLVVILAASVFALGLLVKERGPRC